MKFTCVFFVVTRGGVQELLEALISASTWDMKDKILKKNYAEKYKEKNNAHLGGRGNPPLWLVERREGFVCWWKLTDRHQLQQMPADNFQWRWFLQMINVFHDHDYDADYQDNNNDSKKTFYAFLLSLKFYFA